MVADVIVETPDTSTLVLFTGNDRLDYQAGHFLTIDPHQFEALDRFTAFLEHLKGKVEPPRAYSMCSAPHERYLAVTVKEERFVPNVTKYPPLLSPLLVKRTVRERRHEVGRPALHRVRAHARGCAVRVAVEQRRVVGLADHDACVRRAPAQLARHPEQRAAGAAAADPMRQRCVLEGVDDLGCGGA